MVDGSCLCGAVRINSTGEVTAKALCHCLDCRKITGSLYSTNIVVASDGFSVTAGTPKASARKAESGETITTFFCGDCGSTLWRETPTYGGSKIIRVGILDSDGALEDAKPLVELFVRNRPSWLPAVPGAAQHEGA